MAIEYNASQVVKLVDKSRQSESFHLLYEQMENDFDLYALTPYQAPEGHQSYTSPAPKNDFMKVFHSVNKASLTWKIRIPDDAPEDKRKRASLGERLITGILDSIDRKLRKLAEPPLRTNLAWFACGRGAVALKCLIYPDEQQDGRQTCDIRGLDPMWVCWEKGSEGLVWLAFIYHVGKGEAKDRWNKEIGGEHDDGIVIDWFDRKNNAVILYSGTTGDNGLDDAQFVKQMTPHGLDHVPVFVGFAGGTPTIHRRDNQLALREQATSVYSAARNIYPTRNKNISFWMDITEKSVAGTLLNYSEDGRRMLQGNPFGSWKVINLKTDKDRIVALEPPKAPPEAAYVGNKLEEDLQRSTIPFPIGYGLDPQAHSGAALAMINDNTRSVYGPFTELLADAYRWLCEEILIQFKKKGQKITVQGLEEKGQFFENEIVPDDIDDTWYIEVKCEPKLPRDEAAELNMALAATNPRPNGRPFLSDLTAYEKIVRLQDPDAETIRIDDQITMEHIAQIPNLAIRKMAAALFKKGDRAGAIELLNMMPSPGSEQPAPGNAQGGPAGAGAPNMPVPGGMMPPSPQTGTFTPEQLAKLEAIAQAYLARTGSIPQEILAALQMAKGGL